MGHSWRWRKTPASEAATIHHTPPLMGTLQHMMIYQPVPQFHSSTAWTEPAYCPKHTKRADKRMIRTCYCDLMYLQGHCQRQGLGREVSKGQDFKKAGWLTSASYRYIVAQYTKVVRSCEIKRTRNTKHHRTIRAVSEMFFNSLTWTSPSGSLFDRTPKAERPDGRAFDLLKYMNGEPQRTETAGGWALIFIGKLKPPYIQSVLSPDAVDKQW